MTVPCYQPIRDQYFYREGFTHCTEWAHRKAQNQRKRYWGLTFELQFTVYGKQNAQRDKQCTLTLTAAIKTDRSSEVIALKQR